MSSEIFTALTTIVLPALVTASVTVLSLLIVEWSKGRKLAAERASAREDAKSSQELAVGVEKAKQEILLEAEKVKQLLLQNQLSFDHEQGRKDREEDRKDREQLARITVMKAQELADLTISQNKAVLEAGNARKKEILAGVEKSVAINQEQIVISNNFNQKIADSVALSEKLLEKLNDPAPIQVKVINDPQSPVPTDQVTS